ncbi:MULTISPECIES: hypothetical protein [Aestuariibaculum]|uniref:Uncharacterized protein n=1 Tax=Aestuariibaculum marinum TaxID=2683592 RepID=A0A8J6U7T7_9FLAO|nr:MULTISPECIES: hypothetical protein [Aestuariibaculum]MBD0823256.1 hypothetical protein [Aestuariibaculum marinum]WMI66740.1 hypothetical protein RBH94_06135 [Aestuariibaculum sp. YM273]
MKKKLESELVSIAHRILKLKGKEDVLKMHAEATLLLEKLSVLKFSYEHFDGEMPVIGEDASFYGVIDSSYNDKISDNREIDDRLFVNLDEKEDDGIMEPAIEKIKNMVAFMPDIAQEPKQTVEDILPKTEYHKNDLEDLTADYKDMPIFDPVPKEQNGQSNDKKSLNDKLKNGGLAIGLNDKLAFIKHLFEGNGADYDRVISQINTIGSFAEAKEFIETMVKPDHQGWANKEEYEARFMEIIEGKFN